jgi:hypothetical protein
MTQTKPITQSRAVQQGTVGTIASLIVLIAAAFGRGDVVTPEEITVLLGAAVSVVAHIGQIIARFKATKTLTLT